MQLSFSLFFLSNLFNKLSLVWTQLPEKYKLGEIRRFEPKTLRWKVSSLLNEDPSSES
jgi:hypothetical protein